MTTYGYPVTVRQSYQPTTQGAEISPALYFTKVDAKRIGNPKRDSTWDAINLKFVDTDIQRSEVTFQVTALVRQIPQATTQTQPTAADYAETAAMIVNSLNFINTMQASGIGVVRITEVRNPYFKNDRDQYEASPSFDITFIYNRTLVRDGLALTSITFNTDRV